MRQLLARCYTPRIGFAGDKMWRASVKPLSTKIQGSYRRGQQAGVQACRSTQGRRSMSTEVPQTPPPPLSQPLPKDAPPPPPKKGGIFWKLVGLTLVGAGGSLAYAWYDPKFKKQITDNVPYSTEALDYVFNYLPPVPGTESKVTDMAEVKSKGLARPILTPAPPTTAPPPKEEPKKPLTPAEQKALEKEEAARKKAEEKMAAEEKKKQERERIQRAIQEKEEDEAAQNKALETVLAKMVDDVQHVIKMAVQAQKAATDSVKQHTQQVKDAMDMDQIGGKEKQWELTTASTKARADAIAAAETAASGARLQLEKLSAGIKDGKENAITKKNKALREAEKQLSSLTYTLNSAVAENTKAQSAAKVMADYRDLVRKGKDQFRKELESIMPDVKIGNRFGGRMTEEELNSLIAHAHRRIEQLQKQLAEQQAMERLRIEEALDKQKVEDDKLSDLRVEREERRLRDIFAVEKENWDADARVQFEQDLRQHLSRQAAAHSDHLAEVLTVQEKEMRAEFEALLGHKILEARDAFQEEIAGWTARMKGIEAALEGRAEMEKIGRKAQELWLACQTLQTVIQAGREGATSWEEQMQPLEGELKAIKDAGRDHTFVNTVIGSVPAEAATRGVWTEDALVTRFSRVRRVCRRVAMIGDEGANSLFMYVLSYLQSLFIFNAARPISDTEEINMEKMNTFMLVDNAYYSLEKGNLEQAVKYINQLQGEPRKVAADWLKEARLLLETRQAADALLGHASARGLGSLF